MRHTAMVVLVGMIGTLGCTRASAPATGEWDAAATASLKAEPEAMLNEIDAGHFEAVEAKMDSDAIAFDFDSSNAPVRMQGVADIKKVFDGYANMMKTQQLKMKSTLVSSDCRATTSMGFCAIEFDQSATTPTGTMGPYKFRGTLVARRVADGWRWAHWHGSFREMPAMPAAAASAKH